MKSNWKLGTLAAIAVAAASFVSQAQAAAFVGLNVTPDPINPSGAVGVDIVVNGLPSAAGGFSLLLDYGNLSFGSYTIGPGGAFGTTPDDLSFGDLGGTVDLLVLADLNLTETDAWVAQNQGGPFTLAHVDFTAGAAGPFTLSLRNVAVANWLGEFDDPAFNLLICTDAACGNSVPEPMTALLVAGGLGALALGRRRKQA